MSNSVSHRIKLIIKHFGLTKNSFSKAIGMTNNVTIGRIVNEERSPSYEILEKIIQTYGSIDARWLITGFGEMVTGYSSSASFAANEVKEPSVSSDYEDYQIRTEMNLVIFRQSKEIFRLNDIVDKLEKDNKTLSSGINNDA
ncbi:MAG: helix-turn-helix transcriptional regulator [Bacteroidota bacterium]